MMYEKLSLMLKVVIINTRCTADKKNIINIFSIAYFCVYSSLIQLLKFRKSFHTSKQYISYINFEKKYYYYKLNNFKND